MHICRFNLWLIKYLPVILIHEERISILGILASFEVPSVTTEYIYMASMGISVLTFLRTLSWENIIPCTIFTLPPWLLKSEDYKDWPVPQSTYNLTAFHCTSLLLFNHGPHGLHLLSCKSAHTFLKAFQNNVFIVFMWQIFFSFGFLYF